jgi:hypothetical protein
MRRPRRNDRLRRLRRLAFFVSPLLGVSLFLFAGLAFRRNSLPPLLLEGVATSLLAAAIFTYLTGTNDEYAEDLRKLGVGEAFEDREMAFDNDDWANFVGDARHRVVIVGNANHGYRQNAEVQALTQSSFYKALKRRGLQIEIYWLDPTSPFAELREGEEERGLRRDTVQAMDFFWQLRSGLPQEEQQRLNFYYYAALPSCGVSIRDDLMIVTNYLARRLNLKAPGLVLSLRKPLRGEIPALAAKYFAVYTGLQQACSELTLDVLERFRETGWPPEKLSEAQLRQPEGE